MMSVAMKRAYKVAEEYDKTLEAGLCKNFVLITGDDGSQFLFADSFVKKWDDPEGSGEWYLVFTEHYGFHVFSRDDEYLAYQFTRTNIERIIS